MSEQIISAFLERGILGVVALVVLIALWYKDRQLVALNARYTKQLIESSARAAQLANEVAGTIKDLNDACDECPFRRFVENLDGGPR